MTNSLATIPSNIPAHVSSLFAQLGNINADASAGISAGMYPLIKTASTRFVLVKDGEEKMVKSLELKVVVLRAKQGFEKRFYAGKYDPNSTDAKAPDCFSLDGTAPAAGCAKPQNTSCSGCDKNVFGSGTDNAGNPGRGKACSDRKLLAVLYPNPDTKGLEVYGFSLPPASLKAWGAYVQTLTNHNIPLPAAFTTISFDEKSTFPTLTFSYGGLMGEKELAQVLPLIESAEVKAIIDTKAPAVSPVAPALAAPKEESGFGFTPEEPPVKEKKERKLKAVEKPVETAPEQEDSNGEDISDDELANLLGINL